jgi:hypothetical protein
MNKFKIGDYVIAKPGRHISKWRDHDVKANTIYKVTEVLDTSHLEAISFQNGPQRNSADRFEKIDPNSLTKLEKVIYNLTNNQGETL